MHEPITTITGFGPCSILIVSTKANMHSMLPEFQIIQVHAKYPRDTQRDTSKQKEKEKDVPLTPCQDEGKKKGKKGKKEKEKRRSIAPGKKCPLSEKEG